MQLAFVQTSHEYTDRGVPVGCLVTGPRVRVSPAGGLLLGARLFCLCCMRKILPRSWPLCRPAMNTRIEACLLAVLGPASESELLEDSSSATNQAADFTAAAASKWQECIQGHA